MRVLIVSSGNSGKLSPFVSEQGISLIELGVELDYFLIRGKGWLGYLSNINKLIEKIDHFKPDLIHAHYGYSGLLANLQRMVPVITTYHGSDINNFFESLISHFSIILSKHNIFVSHKLSKKVLFKRNFSIISCGVNLETFFFIDKAKARDLLKLDQSKLYILFSSSFYNKNKNYPLAIKVINYLKSKGYDINLLEFKGYTRERSNLLMNAVDCILVTSFKESGPLVIKEAMAVNNYAVSVEVGDVSEVTGGVHGYPVTSYRIFDIAAAIESVITSTNRSKLQGRERICQLELSSVMVAEKIFKIYNRVKR